MLFISEIYRITERRPASQCLQKIDLATGTPSQDFIRRVWQGAVLETSGEVLKFLIYAYSTKVVLDYCVSSTSKCMCSVYQCIRVRVPKETKQCARFCDRDRHHFKWYACNIWYTLVPHLRCTWHENSSISNKLSLWLSMIKHSTVRSLLVRLFMSAANSTG